MGFVIKILITITCISIALIALLVWRTSLTKEMGGKILAFIAFFILPILVFVIGVSVHFENSKKPEFCFSCHTMEPYRKSLYIEDSEYLPASHFQNNRIPPEKVCFACHTSYTMFGGLKRKMQGLKHVYAYYLGKVPETIELYESYENRECLHCHEGARNFVENMMHTDIMEELLDNELSCLDCHNLVHSVAELDNLELWQEGEQK